MSNIKFCRLLDHSQAATLITESGYYGEVPTRWLHGTEVYALTRSRNGEYPVACVVIVRTGAQAYLDYLCVDSDQREQGLAFELLEKVKIILQAQDVYVLHTCISGENAAAMKLLRHFGARIGFPFINGSIRLQEED